MHGNEVQVFVTVMLALAPFLAICYGLSKVAEFMVKRAEAAQLRADGEFNIALIQSPQAFAALTQLAAEIKPLLRQLGRKDVSLTFRT
jgi:hypothetical protein